VTVPVPRVPGYDGGAADAPVAHEVLAEVPSVNARVPPPVMNEDGR
jgi:hypothetical protein